MTAAPAIVKRARPSIDPRAAAAYHEAGHAVMCRAVGLRLRSVSIDSDDWYAGQTTHRHPGRTSGRRSAGDRARLDVEKDVLVCLAGGLAQRLYAGGGDDGGAIDAVAATRLAQSYFHSARTAAAYVAFARTWARQILETPAVWAAVERLARALLREGALDGRRAEQVIGRRLAAASSLMQRKDGRVTQRKNEPRDKGGHP